jgi:hypothetical protein
MDTPREPMEALECWHKWYRENRMVAALDEPLKTKGNREHLHDTTNAVTQLLKETELLSFEKAVEYFADTLAEFSCDLSGDQLFNALVVAATNNHEFTKKEYENAKKFLELINGQKN